MTVAMMFVRNEECDCNTARAKLLSVGIESAMTMFDENEKCFLFFFFLFTLLGLHVTLGGQHMTRIQNAIPVARSMEQRNLYSHIRQTMHREKLMYTGCEGTYTTVDWVA